MAFSDTLVSYRLLAIALLPTQLLGPLVAAHICPLPLFATAANMAEPVQPTAFDDKAFDSKMTAFLTNNEDKCVQQQTAAAALVFPLLGSHA